MKKRHAAALGITGALLLFCVVDVVRSKANGILDGISFSGAYADRNGKLLRVYLTPDERFRIYKPVTEFPKEFLEALLLREDRRFYAHHGINPASLIRAGWETYVKRSRVIGASTITMQTAKLKYRLYTRSLPGKLAQIFLALRLEVLYSKQDILDAYVNLAPCGKNIEGFEAASYYFFGKSIEKTDLPQRLMLCVLPQNPAKRCPSASRVPDELIDARLSLFDEWIKERPAASGERAFVSSPPQLVCAFPDEAPHYTRMLELQRPHRAHPQKIIKTTIDSNLQELVESRIRFFINRKRHLGIANAAVLLADSETMEVLAAVGSARFYDDAIQGQVDGNIAKRSPGSALKPFIYALALDQGIIHYDTMLKDTPSSFSEYTPDNYGNTFKGPIKAWQALTESRNIPAITLARKLKNPDLYDFLADAGVSALKAKDSYGLSIVLGSADVTPFELTTLYASLVNGGTERPLKTVMSESRAAIGDTLTINNFKEHRLFSPEAAFIVCKMLEQNPPPVEARPAEAKAVPVAYKTGTSVGFRDSWTAGFFGKYVMCVWIGNFDGLGNNAFLGRSTAAPLFFAIADSMIASNRVGASLKFPPKGVTKIRVCSVSGAVPTDACPHTEEAWFIPGVSPIAKCRIHRKITIDTRSGYRTDETGKPYCKEVVREFWPSDLQALFAEAGLPRLLPPDYPPEQSKSGLHKSGYPPEIRSPLKHTEYVFRSSDPARSTIVLSASADADTKELFWFSGASFICKSAPGEKYEWRPAPGVYELTVADGKGRSDSCTVKIRSAD